ncbi:MAG TPA: tetratricopeptide repeat protein [Candidatus Hydrogenedentes bacterium]|nr:tetratricopeptide repeat protein [Candidatus Hydrogenedentota bacterium]
MLSNPKETHPIFAHKHYILLACILLAGLAIRIAYHSEHVHAPDYASPVLDPQLNDYWARALVSGDWTPPPHADDPKIRTTPYGRPPGYPWILAGIYTLFQESYHGPRIVQTVAGLCVILLLCATAHSLFNAEVALLSAALFAFYWGSPYFEGELNSPIWELLFLLAVFFLFLKYCKTSKKPYMFLSGLLGGISLLIRPNLLVVLFFMIGYLLVTAVVARQKLQTLLLNAGLFVFAVAIPISPVLVRNWQVSGDFVFISYYGGVNAYIGNNPKADCVSPTIPDLYETAGVDAWNCFNYPQLVEGLGRRMNKSSLSFSQASTYFYKKALDFWRQEPQQALWLTLKKAWYFWSPHIISDSKVVYYERKSSPILACLPGFTLISALAFTGMLFFPLAEWRKKRSLHLLLLFGLSYFLSILPFFMSERYRFPIIVFLIPFSAYAVAIIKSALLGKEWKRCFHVLSVFCLILAAMSLHLFPYKPDESVWYLHKAFAYAGNKKTNEALSCLEKSLALNPASGEAMLQAGYIYASKGEHERAVALYLKALEIKPHSRYLLNNLGYEHYLRKEYDRACDYYRRALEVSPRYTLAYNNLGNALLKLGNYEEALVNYDRALAIDPKDPFAECNRGNLFLETERYQEAAAAYRMALAADSGNADAANNLGLALLRDGQAEDSLEWFEMAWRLRPPYPLAHLNAAKAYRQLGLTEEARRHYKLCLEYWPENEEVREELTLLQGQENRQME